MKKTVSVSSEIERTARVIQLEGMFDVPRAAHTERQWEVDLPIDAKPWNIGLIVGPSGSGKTTVARALFGPKIIGNMKWGKAAAVIDAFPKTMPFKEITLLLSSVGFNSPPSWLKPFRVLSAGEQFRVRLARAMAESGANLFVVDEFTSVVDRQVAKIGSHAVAKSIRKRRGKFIAVSCHYDIIEWLQPDFTYEPASGRFQWRELQPRPPIKLTVTRVPRNTWHLFKDHHYLSAAIAGGSACFVAEIERSPVSFVAMIPFPHPSVSGWKVHRVVTAPDFQGVGIGHALEEFICGMYAAKGRPVYITASHPSIVHHSTRSPNWKTVRKMSHVGPAGRTGIGSKFHSPGRLTASFKYCGEVLREDAIRFGVVDR